MKLDAIYGKKTIFELERVVFVPFSDSKDCLPDKNVNQEVLCYYFLHIAKMTAGRKRVVILHVTHRG